MALSSCLGSNHSFLCYLWVYKQLDSIFELKQKWNEKKALIFRSLWYRQWRGVQNDQLHIRSDQLQEGNSQLYQSQKQHKIPPHMPAHLLFPHRTNQPHKSQRAGTLPHGNSSFIDSKTPPTLRRTDNRAADNRVLADMAGEVLNWSFVYLI